jgi:hypothetical protein
MEFINLILKNDSDLIIRANNIDDTFTIRTYNNPSYSSYSFKELKDLFNYARICIKFERNAILEAMLSFGMNANDSDAFGDTLIIYATKANSFELNAQERYLNIAPPQKLKTTGDTTLWHMQKRLKCRNCWSHSFLK